MKEKLQKFHQLATNFSLDFPSIHIEYYGHLRSQQRHRDVRLKDGRVIRYTPTESLVTREAIKDLFLVANDLDIELPWPGPVYLYVCQYKLPPESWPKWKKKLIEEIPVPDTRKPDIDNVQKLIMDALDKVAWTNDSRVLGTFYKFLGKEEVTKISFYFLPTWDELKQA